MRVVLTHSEANMAAGEEVGCAVSVVLDGEITLVLDDQDIVLKTGDVVVQRGNNHSWSNRSDKVCRMLYVLIDGRFDPELKAMLDAGGAH